MTAFKVLKVCALACVFGAIQPAAFAFNPVTHSEITKSALKHIATRVDDRAPWSHALAVEQDFVEELLVRATVDADYRPEVFLGTFFRAPIAGASSGKYWSIFTSMFHFINVTVKGQFWDYDGYAYRHSTKQGFDAYLGIPTLVTRGDLSPRLGGRDSNQADHGVPLGTYNLGFKGSAHDWNKLFLKNKSVAKTVFPPSDVVAQSALNALLTSAEVTMTSTESWNNSMKIATGVVANKTETRHYWRGEVAGLPRGFDLLGLVFHMAQDASVPQHAEGTADNCHQELEDLADRLACQSDRNIDVGPYANGDFTARSHDCQALYDPSLVDTILKTVPELDPAADLAVRSRIQAVAKISARWKWGEPNDSVDKLGTQLPSGVEFTGDHCAELLTADEVKEQLKFQYNLAVAATVAVYEQAGRDYAKSRALPTLTLGFESGQ